MLNQPATEEVKPSMSIAKAQRSEPRSIYGRRLPYGEDELSARTPAGGTDGFIHLGLASGNGQAGERGRTDQRLYD